MKTFPIIDADGHVSESNESLKRHLKREYRDRPLMHSEAWDRTFGGTRLCSGQASNRLE
jgi:hypothetical protein